MDVIQGVEPKDCHQACGIPPEATPRDPVLSPRGRRRQVTTHLEPDVDLCLSGGRVEEAVPQVVPEHHQVPIPALHRQHQRRQQNLLARGYDIVSPGEVVVRFAIHTQPEH
jgi:hypothetical protein